MFGKSTADDTAAQDAQTILDSIDNEVLKSAWDVYAHIKQLSAQDELYPYANQTSDDTDDYEDTFEEAVYTWDALKKVIEYGGDFGKFKGKEGKSLLKVLKEGYLSYDDVIHTLIDHHNDEEEARTMFAKHPKLHEFIPPEYDNPKQAIEVLIELIRDYQWQLQEFYRSHAEPIDAAL